MSTQNATNDAMKMASAHRLAPSGAGATARNVFDGSKVRRSFTLSPPRPRTLTGESPSELWHSPIPGPRGVGIRAHRVPRLGCDGNAVLTSFTFLSTPQ